MRKVLGGLLPAAVLAVAALKGNTVDDLRLQTFSPVSRDLSAEGLGPYPLEGKVEALLAQPRPAGWQASGFTRGDYLDLMEPLVRMAVPWVNEQGALIDPVIGREWAQATPRFVSSAAILLRFGRLGEHRETVYRAMTYCCERLSRPEARAASPDFWMRELATAYVCLRPLVPGEQAEAWRRALARVEPEAIYQFTDPTHQKLRTFHNWAVYSSAGESLRAAAGIGAEREFLWGQAFFDTYMAEQIHRFTPLGMYRDPADPITYDITTRLQFAAAIAFGYDGPLRGLLEELLRRGNLTLLLFVSPDGYVPYGGRSSQFNFQEAIVTALCELEANRYAKVNPRLAGAFKRQAHRSARCVRPWLLDSNPVRHIKNQFPPETLHGCDTYGQYSVYSQLAASFFGLAALFADDTIAEEPAPAELGGYVLELTPSFHKVFAACGGNYVEIDTGADANHDATGIGRILLAGLPPGFPLGLPFAAHPKYTLAPGLSAPPLATAMGPEWEHDGQVRRLAEWGEPMSAELKLGEATPAGVAFEVVYRKEDTVVHEACRLDGAGLEVTTTVDVGGASLRPLRYVVPVLVSDGATRSVLTLGPTTLTVAHAGAAVVVSWSAGCTAALLPAEFANRNGVYRALVLESGDGTVGLAVRRGAGIAVGHRVD